MHADGLPKGDNSDGASYINLLWKRELLALFVCPYYLYIYTVHRWVKPRTRVIDHLLPSGLYLLQTRAGTEDVGKHLGIYVKPKLHCTNQW